MVGRAPLDAVNLIRKQVGMSWIFQYRGADRSIVYVIYLISKMTYKRVKWILRRYTVICVVMYVGWILNGKNAI